jgi:hypothetical protein
MATPKFRHFPVYMSNKKIATMSQVNHDIESGDELQFGAEGVLGHSDGIITVKLEADCVIPVAGSPVGFLDTIINKRDVSVRIFCDGKYQMFKGRIISANYTSNSRNGEARGKFVFTGGAPQLSA